MRQQQQPLPTAHPPDVLLAKGTHKILHLGLGEMLIIIFHQLGIDGGHCHEHTDTGGFRAQELLPHLGRKGTHVDENTTLLSKISWMYSWKLFCAPHPCLKQVPNFNHILTSQGTMFISHPTSGSPTHHHSRDDGKGIFKSCHVAAKNLLTKIVAELVHSPIMPSSSKAAQSHQFFKAWELFGKTQPTPDTIHSLEPFNL